MDFDILHEDNHILVAVKPQNLPTQADSSGDADFLSLLKDYLKQKYDKPGNVFLGLVHRLDRPTGGVMVFAKTSKAAERLCQAIREGDFEKEYLAVTVGCPKEPKAQLTHYLKKNPLTNVVSVVPSATEGASAPTCCMRCWRQRAGSLCSRSVCSRAGRIRSGCRWRTSAVRCLGTSSTKGT